jgi:hypothetical protein
MLTPVLITLLLQSATLHCANPASAETPVLRSSSGIEASLKVETHDDWGKNTHLCQADYTPTVTQPGRSPESTDGIFGNDDAWGRPIAFRLEGFTQNQKEIFGIFSEGGKYPILEIFAYHIAGQAADIADLTRAFPRSFGAACLTSLSVIGTTQEGAAVLSSEASPLCSVKGQWKLQIPNDTEVSRARELHHPIHPHAQPIQKGVVVVPLDAATTAISPPTPQAYSH